MSAAESFPEIRSDYEVVSEILAETRIEHNLRVLDGDGTQPDLTAEVEYWAGRARDLAESANNIIVQ